MTREEANKKIAQLQNDIEFKWEEIEYLCTEHKIVISRPDEDAYKQYFYADKETLTKHMLGIGYDEEAIEDILEDMRLERRVPGWIGSAEFE